MQKRKSWNHFDTEEHTQLLSLYWKPPDCRCSTPPLYLSIAVGLKNNYHGTWCVYVLSCVLFFCFWYFSFVQMVTRSLLSLLSVLLRVYGFVWKALGLVSAGTNNSRVAQLLRQLSEFYAREASHLFVTRIAQGLNHMGKVRAPAAAPAVAVRVPVSEPVPVPVLVPIPARIPVCIPVPIPVPIPRPYPCAYPYPCVPVPIPVYTYPYPRPYPYAYRYPHLYPYPYPYSTLTTLPVALAEAVAVVAVVVAVAAATARFPQSSSAASRGCAFVISFVRACFLCVCFVASAVDVPAPPPLAVTFASSMLHRRGYILLSA